MIRGKQDALETVQYKVDRSMKNTDIKTIAISESFTLPCTYFMRDGVPEEKTCMFQLVKLFPGGNEVVIATKEVNLSRHFGDAFRQATVEMDVTKQAQGSMVKSFTYSATVVCKESKDQDTYNKCVEWCQLVHEREAANAT